MELVSDYDEQSIMEQINIKYPGFNQVSLLSYVRVASSRKLSFGEFNIYLKKSFNDKYKQLYPIL